MSKSVSQFIRVGKCLYNTKNIIKAEIRLTNKDGQKYNTEYYAVIGLNDGNSWHNDQNSDFYKDVDAFIESHERSSEIKNFKSKTFDSLKDKEKDDSNFPKYETFKYK